MVYGQDFWVQEAQDKLLSALNSQEPSSRQCAIDWEGPDAGSRMVLYKPSNGQTAIAIISSTNDLIKTQIWYFFKVAVTLSSCTTICRQVRWIRLSLLQATSRSSGNSDCYQAGDEDTLRADQHEHTWKARDTKYRRRESGKSFSYSQLHKTSL